MKEDEEVICIIRKKNVSQKVKQEKIIFQWGKGQWKQISGTWQMVYVLLKQAQEAGKWKPEEKDRQKSALPEMHSMFETPFTAKRDCELLTPSILNRNTKYRQ